MTHHDHQLSKPTPHPWRYRLAFIGFFAIISYFLWTEHRAHVASVIPYLPYLLLLACPFLHFFMHGGHGHHHDEVESTAGKALGDGQGR